MFRLGFGRGRKAALGVALPSIPFTYDADTYWWDMTYSGNDVETTGDDTVSYVPERIAGLNNFGQLVKAAQPLLVAEGVNFNLDTARQMILDNVGSISNGSDGWYLAVNLKADTGNCGIFAISRSSGSTASRAQIYITGSRNFALKAANNDGSSVSFVGYGPVLTYSVWYTLEMRWRCNPNTLEIWYNGVLQTLASGPTGTYNAVFPATNPSEISIGNIPSTDVDSLDGTLQHVIFHDGVPSDSIRSSISTFLNAERP